MDYDRGLALLQKALTTKPQRTLESRERLWRVTWDLVFTSMSLLAASASALSWLGTTVIKADTRTVAIVIGLVGGLTALVALISVYRQRRPSRMLEPTARGVERAYLEALDRSTINPLRAREVNRG